MRALIALASVLAALAARADVEVRVNQCSDDWCWIEVSGNAPVTVHSAAGTMDQFVDSSNTSLTSIPPLYGNNDGASELSITLSPPIAGWLEFDNGVWNGGSISAGPVSAELMFSSGVWIASLVTGPAPPGVQAVAITHSLAGQELDYTTVEYGPCGPSGRTLASVAGSLDYVAAEVTGAYFNAPGDYCFRARDTDKEGEQSDWSDVMILADFPGAATQSPQALEVR